MKWNTNVDCRYDCAGGFFVTECVTVNRLGPAQFITGYNNYARDSCSLLVSLLFHFTKGREKGSTCKI